MRRPHTLFVLLVVGLALALLGGATSTRAAPGQPQRGGTLVFALGVPVVTTEPGIGAGSVVQTIRKVIYESLVWMAEDGTVQPLLATSWTLSPDKRIWTFNLRRNVKFHDGTPFNAAAVKATLDRLMDPAQGLPRRTEVLWIRAVEVQDDYTVRIVTEFPFGPALRHLAMDSSSMISPAAIRRYGKDVGWNPVGTGAYRFESRVPEESVTVARFDDYWGGPRHFDKIVFRTVREDATRVAMLEAGEAHVIVNVPGADAERLQRERRVRIRLDASTRVAHIGFNVQRPPFNNTKLRQALNYAVNRDAIVKGVLRGIGSPAKSVLAPATWGYAEIDMYSYNPEKAKQLLAEAGFAGGLDTTLWTPQGRYFMDRETAVAVQGQFQAVGVRAQVRVIDWASYLQLLRRPLASNETPMYLLGWESGTADAASILDIVFKSDAAPPVSWNTMFYRNARVDALIEAGRRETDTRNRLRIYTELQKIVLEDAPWVPLFVFKQVTGLRANVEGVGVLPNEVHLLRDTWIRR
ncbi:MAG: glutathione ABC transporter substrate-binding protein [Armatimonadetes bacterium]|nr:glutathione ABC transporter substrate-binding protein [Armatimonadota bacterium]